MISEIRIQNFKSIQDLTLKLGRVTVLIGANGSGKSNILEGIAFASGASADRLDNVFLSSLGIRVTEANWMRSAFPDEEDKPIRTMARPIRLEVKGDSGMPTLESRVFARVRREDRSFLRWNVRVPVSAREIDEAIQDDDLKRFVDLNTTSPEKIRSAKLAGKSPQPNGRAEKLLRREAVSRLISLSKKEQLSANAVKLGLTDFLIYAPDYTTLRAPPPESATLPLGGRGEGLLTLLQSFANPKLRGKSLTKRLDELKHRLRLFAWFEDLIVPDDEAAAQARLELRDRWLASDRAVFDQRSANEGFLYVLFYFVLMMSWRTPKFFAIDNLDNALNPKLCAELMQQIVELARTYGKQVICTTHNPAILEGLDLTRDDERLYAVRRDAEGRTVLRRIHAPQPQPGEDPASLADAFMRGLIGGLPENF